VRAYNSSGNSAYSNIVAATTSLRIARIFDKINPTRLSTGKQDEPGFMLDHRHTAVTAILPDPARQ
jgi:hypothetical protein